MVYVALTGLGAPAAPLPVAHEPGARVSPAPFKSSSAPSADDAKLLRSPATFFASCHADGWEAQQLRRLDKLVASTPDAAAPKGAPGAKGAAAAPKGWLLTVAR
eukprot:2348192-Prymnesium_polylepis.1